MPVSGERVGASLWRLSLSKNRDLITNDAGANRHFTRAGSRVDRMATAKSDGATRRTGAPAIVALATALAALTALPAEAASKQKRAASPTEATAPREAGEPIMVIVSIKSQQVTFYDADGWILRAPV